ncbi:hypothetical protein E4U33_001366 [Claviceps sp. LM78 group G4]|nr:hypothetical protein E4U33_001366 [Claviceps sp. LM78 group G4]
MPFTASDICKIILAVILPPVGVFLEVGCGSHLLINILLTILGTYTCLAQLRAQLPRPHAYAWLNTKIRHFSHLFKHENSWPVLCPIRMPKTFL